MAPEILAPVATPPVASPNDTLVPATTFGPDLNAFALMEFRSGQVRRREYRPLGTLERVHIEPSGVANKDPRTNELARRGQMVQLDWYKTGPLVGISQDGQDLLICGRMVHPPAIPDPNWSPPITGRPPKIVNGIVQLPTPPKIEQRLRDCASGILREPKAAASDFWFVFQPVNQMLVLLAGRTGFGMVQCSADAGGKHVALLYNPHREEGHILFGRKEIEFYR